MWSQRAPAEDMIVVSEMGEQWSPQTAPARQAEIEIIISSPPPGNTAHTIGNKIVASVVFIMYLSSAKDNEMFPGITLSFDILYGKI